MFFFIPKKLSGDPHIKVIKHWGTKILICKFSACTVQLIWYHFWGLGIWTLYSIFRCQNTFPYQKTSFQRKGYHLSYKTVRWGAKIFKCLYLSLQAPYNHSDTIFGVLVFEHFIQFLGAKTLSRIKKPHSNAKGIICI